MCSKLTIAIDGHSSCGKSTLAKAIARALNYTYIDSGAMYRGVSLYTLQHNLFNNGVPNTPALIAALPDIDLEFKKDETGTQQLFLNGENVENEIRKPEVAKIVSQIAAISSVRKKLVQQQKALGEKGGIVMDGRDIGSVVFPDAEIKFFVTAASATRASRRFNELKVKGIDTTYEATLENLLERDQIDSTRVDSPLIKTEDAILIDNTHLSKTEQLEIALSQIQVKLQPC
ncbi:MAG: (d)CMP kinase [Bacteroidota bacterium]